ncbi:MAG TPA: glycosyltransferase family 2 protein [Candidatus Nanoarchaeia archaeon]|nr:glycosyltransferase family 2 protein [Candidatus Nanoarchaeia archaeon]
MAELSIIIPVFNEERAIQKTVHEIQNALKRVKSPSEIILVNDGSTDTTPAILKKISGVRVLMHGKNKGYGAALKTGICHASGKWILIVDADGTYPIDAIPTLLKDTAKFDMVVGSRTGENVHIPFFRRPAKWFLNRLVTYLTGTQIPDLNSGLRVFKKEIADRFFHLFPEGFSFTTTITVACLTNGYSVKFVPINYYKRKGKSTMRPHQFFAFLQLILRLITYFKPLNFFLPLSVLFVLVGALRMVRDYWVQNSFGIGGVTVVLAGIQIFMIGLLADLIIHRTKL